MDRATLAPWLGPSPLEFRATLNEMNNQAAQLRVPDADECVASQFSLLENVRDSIDPHFRQPVG
jgi:hypothetical protein